MPTMFRVVGDGELQVAQGTQGRYGVEPNGPRAVASHATGPAGEGQAVGPGESDAQIEPPVGPVSCLGVSI